LRERILRRNSHILFQRQICLSSELPKISDRFLRWVSVHPSKLTRIKISYTGAFAAALGKSLLGSATIEVFGGRVLDLAKKLKSSGKMVYFKPLCFTSYVMVTPIANPAGIEKIEDMARPGVRVVLAPDASPPGGQAALNLLKKAGNPARCSMMFALNRNGASV
jgi:hypothetical protein